MSTDTKDAQDVEVIAIQEEKDGSAVVELPASIPSPRLITMKGQTRPMRPNASVKWPLEARLTPRQSA
jgi:hypothetical protein